MPSTFGSWNSTVRESVPFTPGQMYLYQCGFLFYAIDKASLSLAFDRSKISSLNQKYLHLIKTSQHIYFLTLKIRHEHTGKKKLRE